VIAADDLRWEIIGSSERWDFFVARFGRYCLFVDRAAATAEFSRFCVVEVEEGLRSFGEALECRAKCIVDRGTGKTFEDARQGAVNALIAGRSAHEILDALAETI
jgi:hypothetical protein